MRKIWALLKNHVREDFSWPYYLTILGFVSAGLLINFFYPLETKVNNLKGALRIPGYFALYGVAYYGGFFIMVFFRKQYQFLRSSSFWWLSTLGIFILALASGFPYLSSILNALNVDVHIFTWVFAVTVNSLSIFLISLPLFLIYVFLPITRKSVFGLVSPGYDIKPYLLLLVLMFPLIVIASFNSEFLDYYPTYKHNSVDTVLHIPSWLPMITYEFFYGLDFFHTELFFRGFLIIGLSAILGKHAIIPMVCTYCFLHFGKPLGEAISSIFGGYILGVLAYYTRGIWGGVIIHIGIGWMMDGVAFAQKAVVGR